MHIDIKAYISAESLDDAVRQAIRGNESDWEFLYDNTEDAAGFAHMEIYPDDAPDTDPITVADYIEEQGWTEEQVEAIRKSEGVLCYNSYLSPNHHPTIGELALERVKMDAPKLGGALLPALHYTFSASTDMGKTPRNPTDSERRQLASALRNLCRDCGDADRETASAGFECGHIAHPECHVTDGKLTCAYASDADPGVRVAIE